KDAQARPLLDRLLGDASRLEVQLENSLYVGRGPSQALYLERMVLSEVLNFLADSWPNMRIHRVGDARVKGDKRALQSLFNNVIHNSIVHGNASEITVQIVALQQGRVRMVIQDNGSGF